MSKTQATMIQSVYESQNGASIAVSFRSRYLGEVPSLWSRLIIGGHVEVKKYEGRLNSTIRID